ncbi:MAG: CorA family divalent cation transporter [Luteimonas sp.]
MAQQDSAAATSGKRGGATGGPSQVRVQLFDCDGGDATLEEAAIDPSSLSDRQLLWVDLQDNEGGDFDAVLKRITAKLGLDEGLTLLQDLDGRPHLVNFGEWFVVQVNAIESVREGGTHFNGRGLNIACGTNFLLSVHRGPLQILDEFHARERGETRLGSLRAESFTASLLDWQVDTYLHAVTRFETAVDRLEVALLGERVHHDYLPQLAQLRRGASRLRRMLAPHRQVFASLARPDFRPDSEGKDEAEFRTLERRFERAIDAVEMARELVVGSFELFTTRSAQRTNETMRVLTFVTVLLGTLAVVAGALGMNFKATLFDNGNSGFWITLGLMGAFAILATVLARWRRWM